MVRCAEFLRDYSDFRDGLLDPVKVRAYEKHLEDCRSCQKYDDVIDLGVGALRELPGLSPSEDFLPRLQHKLYHVEEEASWSSRGDTSGTSLGFVLLLVLLIGAAAWLPVARSAQPPVVELPPMAANAPKRPATVHALFRAGPLLPPPRSSALANPPVNTVFFRYTPLGSHATYPSIVTAPR